MKLTIVLLLAITLGGCAMTPMLTGSLCTAGPIRPDEGAAERWTRSETEQVVVLNEAGEKICGWKP